MRLFFLPRHLKGLLCSLRGHKWLIVSFFVMLVAVNAQYLASLIYCCCWLLAVVYDSFATPWMVVRQAPLSMRFPRQEYWNGLPFPSPGDLPHRELDLVSPASPILAGGLFYHCPTWEKQDSPGGPVVKTLHFQWQGWGFDLCLGN